MSTVCPFMIVVPIVGGMAGVAAFVFAESWFEEAVARVVMVGVEARMM